MNKFFVLVVYFFCMSLAYGRTVSPMGPTEVEKKLSKAELASAYAPVEGNVYFYELKPKRTPPGYLAVGVHLYNGKIYYGYRRIGEKHVEKKHVEKKQSHHRRHRQHRRTKRRTDDCPEIIDDCCEY